MATTTQYRTHDHNGTPNPLTQLSDEPLEAIGREFDQLHEEVRADLGDREARYIPGIIALQRRLALIGRAALFASRFKTLWWLGMATLSTAKILENMEIGHNVMHGQWDWKRPRDQLAGVGLGHCFDEGGVEALPQLHPPHVHQHPGEGCLAASDSTR